jgi:hypothetical protein
MRSLLATFDEWRKGADSASTFQHLLFRYGFLAYGKGDRPKGDSTWRTLAKTWGEASVGPLTLRTHPEAEIRIERIDAETEIAIIGPVFSTKGSPLNLAALAADPPNALRHMSGRFALIVSRGESVSIFHDAFGARTIYYWKGGDVPAFASHAGLVGHAFRASRSAAMQRLVGMPEYAKRTVKYLPGDMTMFEGVFALVPNNFLRFPSMETLRYWPDRDVSPSTFEDFFQEIDALLMRMIDFLGGRYVPIFGITGGIDSRVMYAASRKRGISFRGVTWLDPYLKASEVPTVEAIVAYLGVPHDWIEVAGGCDLGAAAIARQNIGEFRGASRLTAKMHALYGSLDASVFIRGYGGEIVRGFYNRLRRPMQSSSSAEMARAYGATQENDYCSAVRAAFDGFRQRANYRDVDRFKLDMNDLFYWEHRMGMWGGAMLNEMDPACLSLVGINGREVYEAAFGLPAEERLTKELLRGVARRYDAPLAEIAVH